MSTATATTTIILTHTLEPGEWVAQLQALIERLTADDYDECQLMDGSFQVGNANLSIAFDDDFKTGVEAIAAKEADGDVVLCQSPSLDCEGRTGLSIEEARGVASVDPHAIYCTTNQTKLTPNITKHEP